jgi:hypothetical protein
MLQHDNAQELVNSATKDVKRNTTLTEVQAEAHSKFTGHGSGEYGAGGQATPSNHAPGTKGGY